MEFHCHLEASSHYFKKLFILVDGTMRKSIPQTKNTVDRQETLGICGCSKTTSVALLIPYAPPIEYLPTFSSKLIQPCRDLCSIHRASGDGKSIRNDKPTGNTTIKKLWKDPLYRKKLYYPWKPIPIG